MNDAPNSGEPSSADGLKRFNRYYRRQTQAVLSYADLLAEQIQARLPKEEPLTAEFGTAFLVDLSARVRELETLQWRMVVYGSIPIILLFLSIVGVKWEVSALGVQLSDLKAIKEIVLMVSTSITAYIIVIGHRAFVIEKAIDVVGQRLFGNDAFALYKLRLPRSFNSYMGDLPQTKSDRYAPSGAYLITQLAWLMSLFMSLILFVILSIVPGVYVMIDVWQSPTWPYIGRAAVVVCGLVYMLCVVSSLGIYGIKYRFVDLEKTAALRARMNSDPKSVVEDVMKD